MKAKDKLHMGRVAALGCCAGAPKGEWCGMPAEVHHIRTGQGMKRARHTETISLCPEHHRIGGYGVAIHAGIKAWEEVFGTELDHLKEVQRRLENDND